MGVHIWLVEEVLLAKAKEVQIAVGNSVVCTVSVGNSQNSADIGYSGSDSGSIGNWGDFSNQDCRCWRRHYSAGIVALLEKHPLKLLTGLDRKDHARWGKSQ